MGNTNNKNRKSLLIENTEHQIEDNKSPNNIISNNTEIRDKNNLRNSVSIPNNNKNDQKDRRRETISILPSHKSKKWEPWMFQLQLEENDKEHPKGEVWYQSNHDAQHPLYLMDSAIPAKFSAIYSEIQNISFGKNVILLLTKDGLLYSWGDDKNTLGRDTSEKINIIYCQQRIVKISCGNMFSAFVTENGSLFTFGRNDKGSCGMNGGGTFKKPTELNLNFHVAEVSCGGSHMIVLSKEGNVYTCGDNSLGQLGLSSDEKERHTLEQVKYLYGLPVIQVSAGANHTMVLSISGSVYCWGDNRLGQCSTKSLTLPNQNKVVNPPYINFPFFVAEFIGLGIIKILAKEDQSFALSARGELYGFGSGENLIIQAQKTQAIRDPKRIFITQNNHFVKNFSVSNSHCLCIVSEPTQDNQSVNKLYTWGAGSSSVLVNERIKEDVPTAIQVFPTEPQTTYEQVWCGKIEATTFNFVKTNVPSNAPVLPVQLSLPNINFELINNLENIYRGNNIDPFNKYIEYIFSHPSLLNLSFIDFNAHHAGYKKHSGISMGLLRKFFVTLMNMKNNNELREILFKSICILLDKLTTTRLCNCHETLRVFQVLLESPVFVNAEMRKLKPLDQLLFCLFSLSPSLKNMLLDYLGNYESTFFVVPLTIFRNCLSFVIPKLQSNPNLEEGIYRRTIFFLNNLNQVNFVHKVVPYTQFINPTISYYINLKEEYSKWREGMFSLFQYPFLLEAPLKCKILQLDSEISMGNELQTAVVNSMLTGRQMSPYLAIVVRRKYVIEDAISQLQINVNNLKKPLKVVFYEEEGIDAGGVKKDFFQLLTKRIFDPNFGMFTYDQEYRTYWFNKNATDQTSEFFLVGMILGLAIYNSILLDVQFPMVIYKKLVGDKVGLDDLKDSHPAIGKSLQHLLDYEEDDVEDVFCLSFQVSIDYFGTIKLIDLVQGGGDIPVKKSNKAKYVELYVNYILNLSIHKQFESFANGFKKIAGPVLNLFRAEELELLVCGNKQFDIGELEKSTTYKNCTSTTKQVVWFWEVLKSLPLETQKKFLIFATASDRVPVNGFADLKFVIQLSTNNYSDRLPTAATCFNTLFLPMYKTKEKLQEKLLFAVTNAEGFGLK